MEHVSRMMEEAIWVCKSLFDRGKVSGSAANMSFVEGETLFITKSGSCFGRLTPDSFFQISLKDGELLRGQEGKPSKELPLHRILYQRRPDVKAIVHTHSPYATWWSCKKHEDPKNVMPEVTPYLRMRAGAVPIVPYAPPGSQELFDLYADSIGDALCCLLAQHGTVAGGKNPLDAFYNAEELEETARILYLMNSTATPLPL